MLLIWPAVSSQQVFELDRHLKQSGLANKENVPWDGGIANSAGAPVLDIIRRLVHEIHVITHEAHKVEGMLPTIMEPSVAVELHKLAAYQLG